MLEFSSAGYSVDLLFFRSTGGWLSLSPACTSTGHQPSFINRWRNWKYIYILFFFCCEKIPDSMFTS